MTMQELIDLIIDAAVLCVLTAAILFTLSLF